MMGNRAVLAINQYTPDSIGIYLHWNGGRDSVEGFLDATKKLMDDRDDSDYATARLIQCIGIFFGGNLSLGVDKCKRLDCDNGDNGVYVIDTRTLEIKERHHFKRREQKEYKSEDIVNDIFEKMKLAGIL